MDPDWRWLILSNTGSEIRPVLRAVNVGGQALRKFDQQAVGNPSCVVQQLKLFQQVAAKKIVISYSFPYGKFSKTVAAYLSTRNLIMARLYIYRNLRDMLENHPSCFTIVRQR